MRIVLLRHFPVESAFPFLSSSRLFDIRMQAYDRAGVKPLKVDLSRFQTPLAFCSTLRRTRLTARLLGITDCRSLPALNEVPLHAAFDTRLRIPTLFWLIFGRFFWLTNSPRQREKRRQTCERARRFLIRRCFPHRGKEMDILLISHGFFIRVLARILKAEGFSARPFLRVRHGYPYVFTEG